jgi:hypothetical protein
LIRFFENLTFLSPSTLIPTLVVSFVFGSIRDILDIEKLLFNTTLRAFALGFVCFHVYTFNNPLFSHGQRNTLPSEPLWSPAITLTMSPVLFLALSS